MEINEIKQEIKRTRQCNMAESTHLGRSKNFNINAINLANGIRRFSFVQLQSHYAGSVAADHLAARSPDCESSNVRAGPVG